MTVSKRRPAGGRTRPRRSTVGKPVRRASRTRESARDDRVPLDLQASIRRDIVACELAPGQRLKFEELRSRYGAGIGSLREVLMQLIIEGLVIAESNRGFCVAPVTIDELDDITELRVTLERKALAESIAHGGDAWEAGIVSAFHLLVKLEPAPGPAQVPNRSSVWEDRHRQFHDALVAGCRSAWLMRFRHTLFTQAQRYRRLSMLQSDQPGRIGEHRKMMELTLARDIEAATAITEEHIRRTAHNVRAWLAAHGAAAGATGFSRSRPASRQRPVANGE